MQIEVLPDADAVAKRAAGVIAAAARQAAAARGRFTLAVSGGHTPWQMLRLLADEEVPWSSVHVLQVDERIAPAGDPDRNLTHLRESLLPRAPLPPDQLHAMPVEDPDATAAAARYAAPCAHWAAIRRCSISSISVSGPTATRPRWCRATRCWASPAVDVAPTGGLYQNRRRMTLTYPVLNRARQILWVVTGAEKVTALQKLRAADASIPGGRVNQAHAMVVADRAAAGEPA